MLYGKATGGEPAFLVELACVRQVDLGHDTHHFAIRQHKSAVVQVVIHLQRRAYQHDDRFRACKIAYLAYGIQRVLL